MTKSGYGWAVVEHSKINIRTVSDTRRAAIVNWLAVEKGCLVLAGTTDEQVEVMWKTKAGRAQVVEVDITISPPIIL